MPHPQQPATILRQEHNYWRRAHADRLSFLIDGEAYFRAFHEAVRLARHSIFIVGWDIDTRLLLIRDRLPEGVPGKLGELLHLALQRNRKLHVHVLVWDWAVLYAGERQWMPLYNLEWRKHRRLHFHLDDHCPFGASQHQKFVVIDDQVAFIGGFDLSKDRWDTAEHLPGDPRRINTDGKPYRPFHDLQAALSGEAACALGELARERWQRVTGKHIEPSAQGDELPWPESAPVDITDIEVGFSRTIPQLDKHPSVREIEALLIDAIASAQEIVYIENEYLTSKSIGDALQQSMEKPDGPEIILVLPKKTGNWLEQNTMDVLRWRLLQRLREADHHRRLYVCFPEHRGLGEEHISLHSKLLIVDDRFLTLGSANLSNRSMGFDTECNLAFEADDDRSRQVITNLRNQLLGEHLGTSPERIATRLAGATSLIALIEEFHGQQRALEPLDGSVPDLIESLLPDQRIIDPERPVEAEEMADMMLPPEERKSTLRQLAPALITLAILAGLAAAWRWTPLNQWLDTESLQQLMEQVNQYPFALVAVPGAYVLAGLLSIPLTLLVIVTVIVFGAWQGFLFALGGALLSAVCNFALGRWLAGDLVRRVAGKRLNRLSEKLGKRGILTIVTLRLVPIAPYAIVNLVAGASRVGLKDFILGTIIGLTPGLLAISIFSDQVMATIRKPEPGAVAILVAVAAALAFSGWLLSRWAKRRDDKSPDNDSAPPKQA